MPKIQKTLWIILSCCIGLFFLTACNPVVGRGQSGISANRVLLSQGDSYDQTFTSRHAGLAGIEIYFAPGTQPSAGKIILHLFTNENRSAEIASASLDVKAIDHPEFYRLSFSPLPTSYINDYYFSLEFAGSGNVQIGVNGSNSYQDGALYLNGDPINQQSTFLQVYDPFQLTLGILTQGLKWLWLSFLSLWLFLVPGWALLSGLWTGWKDLNWAEKSGLAAGVSLALFPILLLWAKTLGIYPGGWLAWILLILASAFLLWKNHSILFDFPRRIHGLRWSQIQWSSVGLVIVLGLIFGIRFWVIRTLVYPLWGDSYQHTMITQLILDNRGLFESWAPYVPYTSLTVQYGFPADVAFYSWISNSDSPQATLWIGQIINGLSILAIYPLALLISNKKPWAGVAACAVGGLLLPMPMLYANWGRFAQLGGQVILLAAIWLCWDVFTQPKTSKRKIFLVAMVLAGMLLTYYRMLFYFGTFFIAWGITWALPNWRLHLSPWKSLILRAAAIIIASLILIGPWLKNVTGSGLAATLEAGIVQTSPLKSILQDYQGWQEITTYIPLAFLLISAIVLIWGLFQKKWQVAGIFLWIGLLSAVRAGQLINLPGANMMQSFAVLIFLYAPVSLLAGWGMGEIAGGLKNLKIISADLILIVCITGISIWGVYQSRNAVIPEAYGYVTRPDIRAGQWIRQNTPPEAKFLVEGYRIYNGTTAVGSDAGWWMPILAGRQNSLPPQYALMNEKSTPKDYSQKVVDLIATLETNPPNSEISLSAICQMGLTHVYIGQGQGQVGFGATQLYHRDQFLNSPNFQEIYHQDQVSIFSINPQACQSLAHADPIHPQP